MRRWVVAEIGDLWFDCAFCDDRITVPIRHTGGGKLTINVAFDLGVLREHLTTMHPEHADPAEGAVSMPMESADPTLAASPGKKRCGVLYRAGAELKPCPHWAVKGRDRCRYHGGNRPEPRST